MFQELELVYREYTKAREYELNKANLPYARLMHHNPDKWKMKFKMLLERERVISLDSGRSTSVDLRKLVKEPFKIGQV